MKTFMDDDRDILINVLEGAVRSYRDKTAGSTILTQPAPDSAILDPISAAIEICAAYKAVAGHILYSAGLEVVLHAPSLAERLLHRAEHDTPAAAVAWLLRLLTPRETRGVFKAAIWGLSIDEEVPLPDSSRLMPFASLPDSYMKSRIQDRAKPHWSKSSWLSHNYFDVPRAAFIKEVPNFPYIRTDHASIKAIIELEQEARDYWLLIEAASIGHPLAFGFWFEYTDHDLDFASWENAISWSLPEILPCISSCTSVNVTAIQDDYRNFAALPEELRTNLLRSMKRFTLSQCRHQAIDRVLDLALAFEIAVSGVGDNLPISWKVSVRSTQFIGGALETRQNNRFKINELYKLRNKATHGSSLKAHDQEQQVHILQECSDIYRVLLRNFLCFGRKPDWNSLELEPRGLGETPRR